MNVQLLGADSVPIRRQEGGFCIEGPGFYIWDEDPREVARVARDVRPDVPTRRLLIVSTDDAEVRD